VTLLTAIVAALVSAWTIVASLVFSQTVVGLTINELTSERAIRSLEMSAYRRESQLAAAA
jgi:hypothetical protein